LAAEVTAGRGDAARGGIALYLLLAYALTLPTVVIAELVLPSADLVAALKIACLGAFAWHAFAVGIRRWQRGSALVLATAAGTVWTAVFVVRGYQWLTLMPLDFAMILASPADAGRTLEQVLGRHGVLIATAGLLTLVALASLGARFALRVVRRLAAVRRLSKPVVLACSVLVTWLAAGDLSYALNELVFFGRTYKFDGGFKLAPPLVPDYSGISVRFDDSVVILQLESVNSLVLFQPAGDGSYRNTIPLPGLSKILAEGDAVFFPRFWSNGAQTNRAWESILCGVSGNLGPPIANNPGQLGGKPCLPAHLAQAGFTTVFLYSYFSPDFFNLGQFARVAGFQDLAYGPALMHDGDPRYTWGYDDCVFYDRAFDYLKAKGLDQRKRLFAYFEVGTNHTPFYNSHKHPEAHPYRQPGTVLEHYLNSVAEQDYCLLTFWKRFRELGRDDVHLIVLPDHSLWVHETLGNDDAPFATWFAYVPPRRRAAEFTKGPVLAPVPSQAEVYPTLLELLGGKRSQRSFAFALRGEPAPPDYDDCRQMTEPNRRLIVRRGTQRTEYRFRTDKLLMFQGAAGAEDYHAFVDRFACR
jgi:hypothetical protein